MKTCVTDGKHNCTREFDMNFKVFFICNVCKKNGPTIVDIKKALIQASYS